MKLLIIILLLIAVTTEPAMAKGFSGSRSSGFKSSTKTYTAPKTPQKVYIAPKVDTKSKTSVNKNGKANNGTPVQNRGTSWNPFAPNFWFWMFIFGSVSHNNSTQHAASSSATLTPTKGR